MYFNYSVLSYNHSKGKEVKTRLLKIKEPKTFPGCLTPEQVNTLVEACNTLRDKFLVRLLYETGLRHEDMVTGKNNEINVVPRLDNINHVRAKSGVERTVHVSKELMQWYSAYLCDEYPEDIDCDFVFAVIKAPAKGEIGTPLAYKTVDSLFRRLSKKIGIKVNPHLLRHSHVNELMSKPNRRQNAYAISFCPWVSTIVEFSAWNSIFDSLMSGKLSSGCKWLVIYYLTLKILQSQETQLQIK